MNSKHMDKKHAAIQQDFTIETSVSFNVGAGIKKLHEQFNVDLINIEKRANDFNIIVKGTLENIQKLNEAAKNYTTTMDAKKKPSTHK